MWFNPHASAKYQSQFHTQLRHMTLVTHDVEIFIPGAVCWARIRGKRFWPGVVCSSNDVQIREDIRKMVKHKNDVLGKHRYIYILAPA